jgi:flagellar biosynthesis/type III secretory pathway chaperone
MTSDNAILNILKELLSTYKMLFDILHREREYLVKIESEKVEEISKEKDTVIMKLRLLEEERQRLVRKYVEENNFDGDLTLKDLGRITGNNSYKTLRSQLLSLLQSIDETNKFNSILIDRSINYLKTTADFINAFSHKNITQTTGAILSRET